MLHLPRKKRPSCFRCVPYTKFWVVRCRPDWSQAVVRTSVSRCLEAFWHQLTALILYWSMLWLISEAYCWLWLSAAKKSRRRVLRADCLETISTTVCMCGLDTCVQVCCWSIQVDLKALTFSHPPGILPPTNSFPINLDNCVAAHHSQG